MSEANPHDPKRCAVLLDRNLGVIERNIEGIDHARSLLRVTPEGSHLNWLLGHLITSRDGMLRLLDAESLWDRDAAAAYNRGSTAALAPAARPLEELRVALRASQELLEAALADAGHERLAQETGGRSVGDRIDFLVWHETYHAGQTALYRRLAGLEGAI